MKETNRIFHIRDGVLKEHAQTVLQTLPGDIKQFSEFDTSFSDKTIATLSDKIKNVEGEVKDDTLVAEMKGNTQAVRGLMQQCHKSYNTVGYFVDKAFGYNQAVRGEFRMGDLHKARDNQLGMIDLMESIARALDKHKDTLKASGMPQTKIDAIITLAGRLKDTNTDQETSKDDRSIGTQDRVGALNDLYLQLKQISDAATIVFEDNPAKLKAYKLPTS